MGNGIEAIIKTLENKIKDNIITDFDIFKIRKQNNKYIVSNGKEDKIYDKIISTIPIHYLINTLDNVPIEIKKSADNLKYNSLCTIMLGIDNPKINDFSWLHIFCPTGA